MRFLTPCSRLPCWPVCPVRPSGPVAGSFLAPRISRHFCPLGKLVPLRLVPSRSARTVLTFFCALRHLRSPARALLPLV